MSFLKIHPIAAVVLFLLASCADRGTDGTVVIKFKEYKEVQVSSPFEMMGVEPRYVHLVSDDTDAFFYSDIIRAEYRNNKIYILDKSQEKLLVFRDDGTPSFKLDYRGRGPNEYLQITDFDVDKEGAIWVADAQKNRVFKYSDVGKMVESYPNTNEIIKLCCINDSRFLVGLSNAVSLEEEGTALAVTNPFFETETPLLPHPTNTDPMFRFTSLLSKGEYGVFYNWPIDDYLYEISYDGKLLNTYYFDFGKKKVPEEIRNDVITHYYTDLSDYLMLNNAYQVTQDFILCGIRTGGSWYSVVMDRKNKQITYFNEQASGFMLVGCFASGSIWKIEPGSNLDALPTEVVEWLDEGDSVIALITNK